MKKFAVIFAAAVLLAFSAPAFAAINPFMDVPMNSWAYDAVAQLASKGILSGYPDGLYKGRQPMTRYEAASMVARALAYVDMTKASKQDVDMLKRLVVEFKDELDALGVRVDALERDMGVFKRRLGGWRLSGRLRFDIEHRMRSDELAVHIDGPEAGSSVGNMGLGDARVNIDRFFGEDEKAFFRLQVRGRNNGGFDSNPREWAYHYFYATIPFVYGSRLSLGWMGDDELDRRFGFFPDMPGRYANYSWFNDARMPMMKLEKNFEFGNFVGYLAHPGEQGSDTDTTPLGDAWMLMMNFDFKWNEQFGLGIGGQYLSQDDWRPSKEGVWDSVFTGWIGLDFTFTQGAKLHGIFYFQSKSGDDPKWDEGGNAWRVALDLSQDLLGFTSFYAEYGRIGENFWASGGGLGMNIFIVGDREYTMWDRKNYVGNYANDSISFWKVGATQQWNPKVRTWLLYVHSSGYVPAADAGMRQYGIGIDYAYNPYTIFSLNYMKWEGFDAYDDYDYSRIRFTTQVSF